MAEIGNDCGHCPVLLEALQRLNQRHAALLERHREHKKRSEKGEEQLREAHAALEQARYVQTERMGRMA